MRAVVLGDSIEGEAREVGLRHAEHAIHLLRLERPRRAASVLLSGGETTVTVRGAGRGGRNTEYLLGLALGLEGCPDVFALAADTDGRDGSEDNAGAFVTPDTLARARAAGLDPRAALAATTPTACSPRLDDLLVTGPTLTNVNDLRAILVAPRNESAAARRTVTRRHQHGYARPRARDIDGSTTAFVAGKRRPEAAIATAQAQADARSRVDRPHTEQSRYTTTLG